MDDEDAVAGEFKDGCTVLCGFEYWEVNLFFGIEEGCGMMLMLWLHVERERVKVKELVKSRMTHRGQCLGSRRDQHGELSLPTSINLNPFLIS